jgi:hypothetical protein
MSTGCSNNINNRAPNSTGSLPRTNIGRCCGSPPTGSNTSNPPHRSTDIPTPVPTRKVTTGSTCSKRISGAHDRGPRATWRGVETKRGEEGVALEDEESRSGPVRNTVRGDIRALNNRRTDSSTGTGRSRRGGPYAEDRAKLGRGEGEASRDGPGTRCEGRSTARWPAITRPGD